MLRASLRAAPALALVALCFVAAPADAQWTWRDKSGQINASDRPPPRDIPDKDILSRPNPNASRTPPAAAASGASAPPLKPQDRGSELDAKKRAADQEQAAKAKAEEERVAAQKAENCRRARAHMAGLESGQRIARTNEKGEREILDDRGRADEMRQAREVIASECR